MYVNWLDFGGAAVEDRRLESGEAYTQNSHDSDPWLIVDERGTILILSFYVHNINMCF